MKAGDILPLTIEKPAAGGRMLARHQGQVVLVTGTIPGERVLVRVDQVRGGVAFASTKVVETQSADRRATNPELACGGNVFGHIAYARQLGLKQDILRDGFQRIAHVGLPDDVPMHPSPERGYRMRARLHVHGERLGFYHEGTHTLCDPASTGQLLDSTLRVVGGVADALRSGRVAHAVSLDIS